MIGLISPLVIFYSYRNCSCYCWFVFLLNQTRNEKLGIKLSFSRKRSNTMLEEARLIRVEIDDVDRRRRSGQTEKAWLV